MNERDVNVHHLQIRIGGHHVVPVTNADIGYESKLLSGLESFPAPDTAGMGIFAHLDWGQGVLGPLQQDLYVAPPVESFQSGFMLWSTPPSDAENDRYDLGWPGRLFLVARLDDLPDTAIDAYEELKQEWTQDPCVELAGTLLLGGFVREHAHERSANLWRPEITPGPDVTVDLDAAVDAFLSDVTLALDTTEDGAHR